MSYVHRIYLLNIIKDKSCIYSIQDQPYNHIPRNKHPKHKPISMQQILQLRILIILQDPSYKMTIINKNHLQNDTHTHTHTQ